jgi:hypothetical protein
MNSLKLFRRLHLYLGCFFAPILLLFIATGWYQTVNHDRMKSPSEAETWTQKLRVVHTDQIFPSNDEVQRPSSPRLFQLLVGTMSGAMIVTTLLGVILAFRMVRPAWLIVLVLLLGVLVPVGVLWLGQQS